MLPKTRAIATRNSTECDPLLVATRRDMVITEYHDSQFQCRALPKPIGTQLMVLGGVTGDVVHTAIFSSKIKSLQV
jgi:hypothetical protein